MFNARMYHQNDNLFFGRLEDGSVRILKLSHRPPHWPLSTDPPHVHAKLVQFDATIPHTMWASVIAGVSAMGEEHGRYNLAKAFHMDVKKT